ncbi:threonine synthase [Cohnella fermenti]|uniref:Threonine synthase n=1 Tax=Cohnella fermenti TaxID=2565925 RepID=A0A4V3WEP1_9BACL|nr:threonine synthase [Cohnella fermenti]THF76550.1 threonine synthase [Cohnella fermenti]
MIFQLTCTRCGTSLPFRIRDIRCVCGGTLAVEYDMERVRRRLTQDRLRGRAASMWRYRELLPVRHDKHIVSLGEGWTPLVRLEAAAKSLSLGGLWIKRDEQNPTGSFKARGFSAAVSVAQEHGIRRVAVNSNGNAASALAAYAARAGMEAFVFVPRDCPRPIVEECLLYGARTVYVDGLIHDAGRIVGEGEAEQLWHHVGTLQEPGRAEGKKTMGLELAEQLSWQLPDVIVYPTGGGSGVIGMWRAFAQLRELGWVGERLPRFVSVQEAGCQPIVDAMSGRPHTAKGDSAPTGMRVPNPPDLELVVSVLRASGGTAIAVTGDEIGQARKAMGAQGISSSPEGAATWAAMIRLTADGWIRKREKVVLFNTCHAMKYTAGETEPVAVVRNYAEWAGLGLD